MMTTEETVEVLKHDLEIEKQIFILLSKLRSKEPWIYWRLHFQRQKILNIEFRLSSYTKTEQMLKELEPSKPSPCSNNSSANSQ